MPIRSLTSISAPIAPSSGDLFLGVPAVCDLDKPQRPTGRAAYCLPVGRRSPPCQHLDFRVAGHTPADRASLSAPDRVTSAAARSKANRDLGNKQTRTGLHGISLALVMIAKFFTSTHCGSTMSRTTAPGSIRMFTRVANKLNRLL